MGFFPALKKWLPKELTQYLKFIPENLFWHESKNGDVLAKKYGVTDYIELGLK